MDSYKHRYFLHTDLKRFTLKATASAILAFNAEIVLANNCPSLPDVITGTAYANIVCEYSTGIGVEVGSIAQMGSVVGGITVTKAGKINNMSGTGISIIGLSSVANGISNNGTIISSFDGINIKSGSSVSNGIFNKGTISSDVGVSVISGSSVANGIYNEGRITSLATGIAVDIGSHVAGISNSGIINSNGTGIRINASSSVTGDIFNSGKIIGGNSDPGLAIRTSVVSGNISNTGSIIADGHGDAITIRHSTIGNLSNTGKLSSISHTGIGISYTSNVGELSNCGVISGVNGILIHSTSQIGGISNSGTISASQAGIIVANYADVMGIGISNTGTIKGDQTGISIQSTGIISGGISNSGTIEGGIYAINADGHILNQLDTIDIFGQNAKIIGKVYSPTSTVNITPGAIFTSQGSYEVSAFDIQPHALFNMEGEINTINGFINQGTLAIAPNPAPQIVGGDYIQDPGGILQIGITNGTNYGQLSVSNDINMSQNGNILVQVGRDASIFNGEVFPNVLVAGNNLLIPDAGLNVSSGFLWQFIPDPSNSVNLTATINEAANELCQGAYCQGAATTIINQVASGNSLFSPFAVIPTSNGFKEAVSQATPELRNENFQVLEWITRSVVDNVPMWGRLRGQSAGDAMLYQPGKVWLKAYGGAMTQNAQDTVDGFNASAGGVVIGKDVPLTGDWLFGAALAAGGDEMHGKAFLNSQSIYSGVYQGMVYGAKKLPHHFYFASQALGGYENNTTRRAFPIYISPTANGSYNSWFTNLRAELGWSTYAFHQDLVITPRVDASYLFVNQGGYQESGSPMDLSVASGNNSALVLGAYGHGAYHLKTLNDYYHLTLTGYAGLADNVLNTQPQTVATFLAGGSGFSTPGVQLNGAVFRGGIGITCASKTKPLTINVNYDLQSGNNAYGGIGSATLKYRI